MINVKASILSVPFRVLEVDVVIELWNVAFYKGHRDTVNQANDRAQSRYCFGEISKLNCNRQFRLIEVGVPIVEFKVITWKD